MFPPIFFLIISQREIVADVVSAGEAVSPGDTVSEAIVSSDDNASGDTVSTTTESSASMVFWVCALIALLPSFVSAYACTLPVVAAIVSSITINV